MAANGPLYLLHEGAAVKVGLRVEPRHCNPTGVCHGGMLASFCDMLLPLSLQLDSLAPVPLGAWVEGECEVLKATRPMVFAQGLARAEVAPRPALTAKPLMPPTPLPAPPPTRPLQGSAP
ncbi:MAG: PaaI family thioesterase [Rubrivivax sp.]|nr:PaaI family thioesterase [Rubrivivax sp.]